MSFVKAYQNLSPRSKLYVGVGFLIWGFGGLYISEQAERKLRLTPSEQDKAELDRLTPKIRVIDKEQRS